MADLKITPGPWAYHSAQCDPFPPTKEGLLRFVEECWDKSDGEHWGAIVADSSKMVAILGNGPTTGPNSKAIEAVPLYEDLRKAENELQAAIAEARERPLDQSKRDLVSGKKVAVSKALEALNAALEVNGG